MSDQQHIVFDTVSQFTIIADTVGHKNTCPHLILTGINIGSKGQSLNASFAIDCTTTRIQCGSNSICFYVGRNSLERSSLLWPEDRRLSNFCRFITLCVGSYFQCPCIKCGLILHIFILFMLTLHFQMYIDNSSPANRILTTAANHNLPTAQELL